MSCILSNSKNSVLIVSDIFGMSAAFLSLLKDISIIDIAVVISPYEHVQTYFENEQQAYQCFQDNGGMDAYILSVAESLKSNSGIKKIVGFSAGAAAIYSVMSNLTKNDIQLTLFYPGQIRHFLNLHPSSPCHIIFPESESHFLLPDIIKVLKKQSNIKVEQNIYQHGFMNKDSKSFDLTAYNYYCQMLRACLTNRS